MNESFRKTRQTLHEILNPDRRQTRLERIGNDAIALLIFANVLAVILESMAGLRARYGRAFDSFETFSVLVFTLEYVGRVWTAVEDAKFRRPVWGRLRFAVTPMALLDLAVVLPAYLPGVLAVDLRFARVIRVIRMMRVLKLSRYSTTLRTFGRVFNAKRVDVALMTLFLIVLVVLASSLMYFIEHGAQPESFSSIPAAMWWSVMTLTTVGYGDIYPVTSVGKLLGALIALIGIGFFALPAGILAAAFAEELASQRKSHPSRCPHCQKDLA